MRLVVDANVVISALIASEGKTCELLFSEQLDLYSPEYILLECQNHKQLILEKSQLSSEEFDVFFAIIFKQIKLVPFEDFSQLIKKAQEVSPDQNDVEYVALALKLDIPLWTNDKKLTEQKTAKTITTTELLNKTQNETNAA